jgi:hypothetical protein
MQNRSHVTQSIVNNVKYLYVVTDDNDNDDITSRVAFMHPTPVNVLHLEPPIQRLLHAQYSWVKHYLLRGSRRWHVMEFIVLLKAGESVNINCFFAVVGILMRTGSIATQQFGGDGASHSADAYFVLRSVSNLEPTCFVENAPPFFSLKNHDLESVNFLGAQTVVSAKELIKPNQAVCAVAKYILNPHTTAFIPTFGLVDFEI